MAEKNRTSTLALEKGFGEVDTMHLHSLLPTSVFRKDYEELVDLRTSCATAAKQGKQVGERLRRGVLSLTTSMKNLYAVMHATRTAAELQKVKGDLFIIDTAIAETLVLLERIQSSEDIARQFGHARAIKNIMGGLS